MLIIWGTKRLDKELGRVADLCRACQGPQVHRVIELRSVGHLYYISLGSGTPEGFKRVCEQCGAASEANPNDYASICPFAIEDIAELIQETNPDLPKKLVQLEEARKRITEDRASPEERQAVVEEILAALNPQVEARAAQLHVDMNSGLSMLGCFVMTIAFIMMYASEKPGVLCTLYG